MDIEHPTEENDVVAKNISFYIFLTIRTAQLQHGLRHRDYERYRYSIDLACFVNSPVLVNTALHGCKDSEGSSASPPKGP